MKQDFKKKLNQLIEIKDIKQIELANAIGVTEATISRYVNGVQFPRHEAICKMAKYFGVSTDYLMGKEPTESEIEKLLKSSFFEIYEKLEPLEKRRLLTTIIDNIEIKSGKVSAINFIKECTK